MPAIAKGYIDRIISYGFAYADVGGTVKGLLTDKQAVVFQPQRDSKEITEPKIWPAMDAITGRTTFEFCGMKTLGMYYFPSVTSTTDDVRKGYLKQVDEFFLNLK